MKKLILSLLILAGLSKAAVVNLSGQLDLGQTPRSATVSVITSTGLVGSVSQTGSYTITGTTNLSVNHSQKDSPKLSWKTFGKELQITGVGNSENYTVDAWTIDGKNVCIRMPFTNGIAKISGNSFEKVFVRLNHSGTSLNVASRSLSDSTLGHVYFIVNDPSNGVINDTLTEIPITNWISVLGPKYIVGRNVDVTVPNAFVGDTVKVGWFNVYTNPSNYYSTVLGRSYSGDYSGFIYTAYDSASFGNNSYLYSAVSIIKHGDSVVAFSKDLDTVTAKVGNFKFDSTRFTNKILSALDTTLTIPWYAFSVNGTSVALYQSVVKHLDSTTTYSDSLITNGWHGGRGLQLNGEFSWTYLNDSLLKFLDTTILNDTTTIITLDSLKISYTSSDSIDTVYYQLYQYPGTNNYDTLYNIVPKTNIVVTTFPIKNLIGRTSNYGNQFTILIKSNTSKIVNGEYTGTSASINSVNFTYKITTKFYK